jgi:hypothetical protein
MSPAERQQTSRGLLILQGPHQKNRDPGQHPEQCDRFHLGDLQSQYEQFLAVGLRLRQQHDQLRVLVPAYGHERGDAVGHADEHGGILR